MEFLYFSSISCSHKIYVNWKEQPVITTINTVAYPIENIEFPAITICSQGSAKDLTEIAIYRQFQTFLESKVKEASSTTTNTSTTGTTAAANTNATTAATNVAENRDGQRRKRKSIADLKEVLILNDCLRIKVDMR